MSVLLALSACARTKLVAEPSEVGGEAQSAVETNTLPHPGTNEGAALRAWLSSQETPYSLERLQDCQAQVLALTSGVSRREELNTIAARLEDDVLEQTALFHWCYYHLLARLEHQLETDQLGLTYRDRLQQFIRENRALWVLALSLDRSLGGNRYRQTARSRYAQLSRTYFGRNVSAEGEVPMLERPQPQPDSSEAAGPTADPQPGKN